MADGNPAEPNIYSGALKSDLFVMSATMTVVRGAADCTAVYNWMKEILKLRSDDIILYGKSLGTAATIDLATRVPAMGVMLVCPLASGARVVFPRMRNGFLDQVTSGNCELSLRVHFRWSERHDDGRRDIEAE